MNPERKAKLVAALRSGEYKQTQGCLRQDDSFCCLGVATDLYIKDTDDGEWENHNNSTLYTFKNEREWEKYSLVKSIKDYFGFRDYDPEIETLFYRGGEKAYLDYQVGSVRVTLASLNDSGFTFDQIADVIEYFF
jgi:hypothetical protein